MIPLPWREDLSQSMQSCAIIDQPARALERFAGSKSFPKRRPNYEVLWLLLARRDIQTDSGPDAETEDDKIGGQDSINAAFRWA